MDAHFGHALAGGEYDGERGHRALAGELTTVPGARDRNADRRSVELGAGLRQRGASGISIQVHDLSTHGFRASTHLELLPGTDVWLKLPGLEAWQSRVAWMDGHWIGCAFVRPLHPAVLETILKRAG